MTVHRAATAVAALLLASAAPLATPAGAKTCKPEPVSAKSSSRIAGDDAAREQRAKDNAVKHWSKEVQAKHGIAFKFWLTAEDKAFDCHKTAKSAVCTVTAKPYRPF